MARKKWKKQWKSRIAPTRWPGVYQRKEGGCLVRARVKDAATGKLREIKKVLPDADELTARQWLEAEKSRVRAGTGSAKNRRQRFSEYAASLLETKVKLGKIKSRAGRDRWRHTLEHLIKGTSDDNGEHVVQGFGDLFIDQIRRKHVEAWQMGIQQLIDAGLYAPTTANGWLDILRGILKSARRDLELDHLATDGVERFDTSEHVSYSEENPNSLAPADVPAFLATLRKRFPQHYAMAYLGLATGLRPSSLRPLRRIGADADVLWDEGRILVRRSQTRGDEVMRTTKQKRRYSITVPRSVMEVLRWHVDTQLATPEQQESDLLFPSVTGGYRAPTVLNKPFKDVSEAIGLGYVFTQRGMRRTFNDLARLAKVEDLVTRSISGHLTEQMQHHYSTVRGAEQQAGIAKVIRLLDAPDKAPSRADKGTDRTPRNVPSDVPSGAPGGAPAPSGGALDG